MKEIDFSRIQIRDIDGKEIPHRPIIKNFANLIYNLTRDLSMLEVALLLNKQDVVQVDESQVKAMIEVINDERTGMVAFVRKAILDFIS
jgi:hypothetical protein